MMMLNDESDYVEAVQKRLFDGCDYEGKMKLMMTKVNDGKEYDIVDSESC